MENPTFYFTRALKVYKHTITSFVILTYNEWFLLLAVTPRTVRVTDKEDQQSRAHRDLTRGDRRSLLTATTLIR